MQGEETTCRVFSQSMEAARWDWSLQRMCQEKLVVRLADAQLQSMLGLMCAAEIKWTQLLDVSIPDGESLAIRNQMTFAYFPLHPEHTLFCITGFNVKLYTSKFSTKEQIVFNTRVHDIATVII